MKLNLFIIDLGPDFQVYMDSFKPFLFHALDLHDDTQVCITAVGVVSDLCRAFDEKILPIMDEIMAKLLHILQVNCYVFLCLLDIVSISKIILFFFYFFFGMFMFFLIYIYY